MGNTTSHVYEEQKTCALSPCAKSCVPRDMTSTRIGILHQRHLCNVSAQRLHTRGARIWQPWSCTRHNTIDGRVAIKTRRLRKTLYRVMYGTNGNDKARQSSLFDQSDRSVETICVRVTLEGRRAADTLSIPQKLCPKTMSISNRQLYVDCGHQRCEYTRFLFWQHRPCHRSNANGPHALAIAYKMRRAP